MSPGAWTKLSLARLWPIFAVFLLLLLLVAPRSASAQTCAAPFEVTSRINGQSVKGDSCAGPNSVQATCRSTSSTEHVYEITPSANGTITLSTDNNKTTYDTVIFVRTDCTDPATELACDDDGGTGLTSQTTFFGNAGTTYFIVVEGNSSDCGDYELTIDQAPPPTCIPVADLTGDINGPPVSGDSSGATDDATPSCGSSTHSAGEEIYTVTPPTSGQMTIDLDTPVYWDTALHVRTDCDDPTTEIACSDPGTVTFFADAGTTYYVFADGWGSSEGIYDLTISQMGPPTCTPVADVTANINGAVVPGDTTGANDDALPSCGSSSHLAGDDLYTFTPTVPGEITIDLDIPTYWDAAIHLRTDCLDELTEVACSDPNTLTFWPSVGTTYYLWVDGYGSSGGGYDLSLTQKPPPECNPEGDLTSRINGPSQNGNTNGASDDVAPSCGSSSHAGGDEIWTLTPPSAGMVTILLDATWDEVLHVRTDCLDPATEIDCSDPGEVTFYADGSTTYYVWVDSYLTDSGSYSLTVTQTEGDCGDLLDNDGDGDVDCDDTDCAGVGGCPSYCVAPVVETINCSTDFTANTTVGASSVLHGYDLGPCGGCCDQPNEELVYEFTPQTTGSVTITLDNLTTDQDLYVLQGGCDPTADCVQESDFSSTTVDEVTFDAVQGTTYYIVLENWADASGAAADFDLHVDAGAGGGCLEDCNDGLDNDGDTFIDCTDSDCFTDPACLSCDDFDLDGYTDVACGGSDCDDGDGTVFPGAPEIAEDNIDQDCNGVDAINCIVDGDLDGFGTQAATNTVALDGSCDTADGESGSSDDCNDGDDSIHPGAVDVPDDGIDNDCSGAQTVTCYVDADQDGYGVSTGATTLAHDGLCQTSQGESTNKSDCDDTDAAIHPGASEVADDGIDQDCSGNDAITCVLDADHDGFGTLLDIPVIATDGSCDTADGESGVATDCDDTDITVFPGAPEVPDDGIDQDCVDGDALTCFVDGDGDTFGTSLSTTVALDGSCDTADGEADDDLDCDDTRSTVYPGAAEVADDGIDQDCNGKDTITCAVDADRDTFGDIGGAQVLAPDGSCNTSQGEADDALDCDDADASIFPGAPEIADDGVDQDCNGDDTIRCVLDDDQDGYGTEAATTVLASDGSCDAADRESTTSDDCDDLDAAVHPGAVELPGDGVDQDCSGSDTVTCFVDADGDGFGDDSGATVLAADGLCETAEGEADDDLDCDDGDDATFPGAPEIADDGVDQDCSGSDTVTCIADADQDGFGTVARTPVLAPDGSCDPTDGESLSDDDCNDGDATVHPGATDAPDDGIDQDCSGTDTVTCIIDADKDGYGNAFGTTTLAADGACNRLQGEGTNSLDCDDTRASVYPGAPETPDDGVDQDCNGKDTITCIVDADLDGFGTVLGTTTLAPDESCDPLQGESTVATDCDDGDATVHPGAAEIADDGIDQDCNGDDTIRCVLDGDRDGFGTDANTPALAADGSCDTVDFESSNNTDCDDTDATVYPGAVEVPGDSIDQNCDGSDSAVCYVDADLDGHGDPAATLVSPDGTCSDPGESSFGNDCDDTDPDAWPGAPETADDGIDQDCNGSDTITCVVDDDQDGYGTIDNDPALAPDGTCDTADKESTSSDDCDDADPATRPGAPEIPDDGIDQDCNLVDAHACVRDADQDGQGTIAGTLVVALDGACDLLQGESEVATDCDDTDPNTYVGAPEIALDGIDQDCNGVDAIECVADVDQDGFGTFLGTVVVALDGSCERLQGESAVATDCNDSNADIHPGATEIPEDGIDQDCNNADTIRCIRDADRDGFGTSLITVVYAPDGSCDTADGESGVHTDCNDAVATIHPGATDFPDDGIDQDCSGAETITCQVDSDRDGYGNMSGQTTLAADGVCDTAAQESDTANDCNDGDDTIHPGALDLPGDNIDQDCNGLDPITCVRDADGDGFGNMLGINVTAYDGTCDTAQQESSVATDCNDAVATIHPGATDFPDDGIDQNCNGVDTITCVLDGDEDGFGTILGTPAYAADGVCNRNQKESDVATDCNDFLDTIYPGAPDSPDDGVDQDCNGVDTVTCTVDADRDGYGNSNGVQTLAPDGSCDTADQQADDTLDCHDGLGSTHPGASEVCDGMDNDCDGIVDEDTSCYDDDRDGVTEDHGDCDDANPLTGPLAVERCNGIDDDCDGVIDEGSICYDDDGDCFCEQPPCAGSDNPGCITIAGGDCNDNDSTVSPVASEYVGDGIDNDCDGSVDGGGVDFDGDGYTELGGDCAPHDANVYPGALEIPDGRDNDCDGEFDEDTDASDDDDDGWCEGVDLDQNGIDECADPNDQPGDCNDVDPDIAPDATEVANGIDDDCDGVIDAGSPSFDNDGDGLSEEQGDCDDANAEVHPGADEEDNGVDDDCDGEIDEDFIDVDGDGWLDGEGDCNDHNGWVNPDMREMCDAIDNNCDGVVDEDCDDSGVLPPTAPGSCGCATPAAPGPSGLFLAGLAGLWGVRRRRRR